MMRDVSRVTTLRPELPFRLAQRAPVTRIRQRDVRELRNESEGNRTQEMAGFEPRFTDIVDYIVRITDEIWMDRAIGSVYDTYDNACTIYSHYGVVRSVEEVIASTVATLNAFPDGELNHLCVAWSGDEEDGFYTSHLGFSRSTNLGRSAYGPATGRKAALHFAADCVSRENRIHTEWLVRDNSALVRQLGLDPDVVARELSQAAAHESLVVSPETPASGQSARKPYQGPRDTIDGYFAHFFHEIWNLKRLDQLSTRYAAEAVVHSGGGRIAQGLRNIGTLMIAIMTSIPDGVMRVENVCWSDETDGVIAAVRWVFEGSTRKGGVLGDALPEGRPVAMFGVSHFRFNGPKIVEEWTVFDEIGVLAQAYRA